MCRNIRTLFNFDPPATEIETPHDRAVEAAKARARSAARFGTGT